MLTTRNLKRLARKQARPDYADLQRRLDRLTAAAAHAPLTIVPGRTIVLLTESRPPLCCAWPDVADVWRHGAGIELDPDTTAQIEALIAAEKIPGLFVVGAHAHVRAIDVRPLDRCGGIA